MAIKQRYIYSLIFGIPGIAISAFTALFASGVTGGFFWIFVFGDIRGLFGQNG